MELSSKIKALLNAPVTIVPLVYFRIGFGLLLLIEGIRYFHRGWFHDYWIKPEFLFGYEGFEWLPRFSPEMTTLLYASMGLLLLFVILGIFYRISASLFFLGNAYFFLLDKTTYMNHYYLFVILSFLMIFLPAHKLFSLDSLFKRVKKEHYVPGWTLLLLQFQVAIVYIYGGIAKINADWLQGQPMNKWLSYKGELPFVGSFAEEKWLAYLFSYGGLLFDLMIVPFLLFKKTRWFALAAMIGFHLMNSQMFRIGMFPWVMITLTMIFFPPEKFQEIAAKFVSAFKVSKNHIRTQSFQPSKLVYIGLAGFVAFQLLMPLRHHLYSGDPSWTEQGHFFSWRMMLRDKKTGGTINVTDKDTNQILESIDFTDYITVNQKNVLLRRPDMVLQFCKYLDQKYRAEGTHKNYEIKTLFMSSLNGREEQLMIDPNLDLAKIDYSWQQKSWIIPMKTPLYGAAPIDVLPIKSKELSIEDLLSSTKNPTFGVTKNGG